ncbi:MAG TPA: lysophospholipid acyltransferase family protein [Xanthobacteraceae bacterium]|nr:lysophospholipid acyltransferase family protein [Xanthobacteraceae bacterium]
MLRLIGVAAAIGVVTAALIPLQWLSLKFGWPTQRSIPVAYHRILCRLIGVRIRTVGAPAQADRLLIAANHVSWLDISVLIALAPVVFVAKSEVAKWPLFGLLAKLNRSVFVERERRRKTADVNRAIAARMAAGDPVVLFAEGTSSDGNRVLAFRSSLVGAVHAALAQDGAASLCVQPLAIAYTRLAGLPLGRPHRPRIAWYGAMDLLPHLAGVIRRGAIDVVVAWGEPVRVDSATDRKILTRRLEQDVRDMVARAWQHA